MLRLLIIMLLFPIQGSFASSPEDVVNEYIRLDAEGARSSSDRYGEIRRLMDWEEDQDEPGWDCIYITRSHRILASDIKEESAAVTVRYEILYHVCSGAQGLEAIRKDSVDDVKFELALRDGEWRIRYYVPRPRILASEAFPVEVTDFIERRDMCDSTRRGEANDNERRDSLEARKKEACSGTDEELAKLKTKYRSEQVIMAILDQ